LKAALQAGLTHNGGGAPAGLSLEVFRVRVKKLMAKPHVVQHPLFKPDSAHALIGTRKILWGSKSGEAQVYRWESLQPGNRVEGCAILEGVNTTYFIPDGWAMTIDAYGNAKLRRP